MAKNKILVVDDEEFNLDILTDYLTDAGYEVVSAEDGAIALEKLEKNLDIDVIVLDRMMSNMDGMEVLKRIKEDARFKDIPVVMQTAAASSEQVLQGIKAGAFYYLTKPYNEETLLGIVYAALSSFNLKREMITEVTKHKSALGLMESSRFRFRTLEEAKNLSYFIANSLPDSELGVSGINELLVNAVEHGNLGITYNEKKNLLIGGTWREEIERRLGLPENSDKFAYLSFEAVDNVINIRIKDQGKGFDWNEYMDISADRIYDPNGRGIATANNFSFDKMEYIGCGNEVLCTVLIPVVN